MLGGVEPEPALKSPAHLAVREPKLEQLQQRNHPVLTAG
jgi:hypothetical protein